VKAILNQTTMDIIDKLDQKYSFAESHRMDDFENLMDYFMVNHP